jgi:hypothetical protein
MLVNRLDHLQATTTRQEINLKLWKEKYSLKELYRPPLRFTLWAQPPSLPENREMFNT